MKRTKSTISFSAVIALISPMLVLPALAQGDLTPPGAPAPTMKTLQQVEPRTPISSLPFRITNSGSYYLTTNLIGGPAGGITISTNGVTLDLMGFEIKAESIPVASGVVIASLHTNVCVRNGRIRGWNSGVGSFFTSGVVLQDLKVVGNGTGLQLLTVYDAVIDHCLAVGNTNAGIIASHGSLVKNCVSAANGGNGIEADLQSTIINCVSRGNGGTGIEAPSSLVTGCTVAQNGAHGIFADSAAAQVTHCHVLENELDGINVATRSLVRANTVHGAGFSLGTNSCIRATSHGNRIESNHVSRHQVGIRVEGSSNLIIHNSAYFNATNYLINDNNAVGTIITEDTIATNTNPNANFEL